MSYEGLLEGDSILLNTKASSQNAYREWTYTYTASSTPTKCSMVPIKVADRIDRPGLYDDVSYICYTLSSASITRDSQVTYRGIQYKVRESEMDSRHHHRKSLLVEVT